MKEANNYLDYYKWMDKNLPEAITLDASYCRDCLIVSHTFSSPS
jgi:hypothetical protein